MDLKPHKEPSKRARMAANDGLQNVLIGMGTGRDKAEYTGYVGGSFLTPQALTAAYRTSSLAAKVVDIPAQDMTREWRCFSLPEDAENMDSGEAIEALKTAERRLSFKSKLTEALSWSRLYGGSIIVMGMKDNAHDKPLVVANVKQGDLKYLLVADRWQVSTTGLLVSDPSSPHFGCPESYMITGLGLASAVTVHHTRILRFEGKRLPYLARSQNNYWGDSLLSTTLTEIKNKDTISAAMVTMLFEANVDTVSIEGLADIIATEGGEARVAKRWTSNALMKGIHRLMLLDSTEKYERKSFAFAGLGDLFEAFMSDVSAAADIPATRLFGRAPAGMNATGDSDTRNYYDALSAKQESDLRPQIEHFDEVFVRSTLGSIPEGYSFEFKPLWQMSATEQATVDKTNADRDKIYLDAGVITESIIANGLKARGVYPITQADIDLLGSMEEPIVEEPPEDPMKSQSLKQL